MTQPEEQPTRRALPRNALGDEYGDLFRDDEDSDVELTAVHPRRALVSDSARTFGPLPTAPRTTVTPQARHSAPEVEPDDATPADASSGEGPLRRSVALTVLSMLLPGVGLLGARKPVKYLGIIFPVGFLAMVAYIGLRAADNPKRFVTFAVKPDQLKIIIPSLIVLGLAWVVLITLTHLFTRPNGLRPGRKAMGAVAVTLCSLAVAAPLAVASRYAYDQTRLVETVFQDEGDITSNSRPTNQGTADNPWEGTPRVNILLLGGDTNEARKSKEGFSGIRTDTIMVASVDTTSGKTTIVQIPRNVLHTPFPEGSELAEQWPDGFEGDTEEASWITELWETVESEHPNLLQGQTYRGAEALKLGAEGITGLKIDYFVLLNIDGLQQLINAMGGVTVNINQALPKGRATGCDDPSKCLQPGPNQHLNGYDAMWYARSRKNTNDYSRMARQSCLVNAIIKQANPGTMLTSYEAIASASSEMLMTDIPRQRLDAMVQLAWTVKDAKIERLVFAQGRNGYRYSNPDFAAMREAVSEAINPAPKPTPTAAPTTAAPKPTQTVAPSAVPTPDGKEQVTDACAYNPVEAGEEEDN